MNLAGAPTVPGREPDHGLQRRGAVRFTLPNDGSGVTRHDLMDFEWSVIEPLLPRTRPGPKRVDDRRVLNGISGICARVRRGGICRSATVPIRPCTIASTGGAKRVSGTGLWTRSQRLTTVLSRRSTLRSCAFTSTPSGQKGGWRSLHGAISRWADDQDPRPLRLGRPARALGAVAWPDP